LNAWDLGLAVTLLLGLASWSVAHAALVLALWPRHRPRWMVALLVLPPLVWLAPLWGLRYGLRTRVVLWWACLALYGGALSAAIFIP